MSITGINTDRDHVSFASDWQDWHDTHEANRADGHGFLAISSLTFLTTEPLRLTDAPGEWSTSARGPVVELAEGESVVIDGVEVTGRHAFGPLAERTGVDVIAGETVVELARRGGNDIVRPRHPETPLRTAYRGTPTFAADPSWVLDATFHPFDEPRPVTVGSVVEGLEHVYDAPGELRFRHGGQEFALTAFTGHRPGTLTVLFTDATSGVTTYAANRSLSVDLPDAAAPGDGTGTTTTFLDFNRAVNLPCAYTDFATCPLPPRENRLPFAVEAGEQTPFERA
ncbi:hypothetical protein B7R54_08370 [Subtercola boreus]|uniref:DUF1684 domain-containing protein n=1 Tax=Subtercola boreus TaxID=120213 RepID=A0A3E0VIE3_9MICO|nr:DUF1684 domain-containing protein [Subtercola boreus]RFA09238.1 hypothetical protein B7R54_08370 [Subtercola boreus]TQL53736.1 hypothetical protein FB464_1253 [Subtercola boreus]